MSSTERRWRTLSSPSRSSGRASSLLRRGSLDDDRSFHKGMEQARVAVSARAAEDKGPVMVRGDERLTTRIEERVFPGLRHGMGLSRLIAPDDPCPAANGYGPRGKHIRVGAGMVAHVHVGYRDLPGRYRSSTIARYEPKREDDRRYRRKVQSLHDGPTLFQSCAVRHTPDGGPQPPDVVTAYQTVCDGSTDLAAEGAGLPAWAIGSTVVGVR